MKLLHINQLVLIASLFFYSCSKDGIEDFENRIILESVESNNLSILDEKSTRTICTIDGSLTALPDTNGVYTLDTDLISPSVIWSVVSGDIEIVLSRNGKAWVYFGPSFSGGSIRVDVDSEDFDCSGGYDIINASDPSPIDNFDLDDSCLYMNPVDVCEDAQVSLSCASKVQKVEWSYSIGSYNNVSFGTQYNTSGIDMLSNSFAIPETTTSWDNHYLWSHANITLNNGATGTLSTSILLDCPIYEIEE